MRDCAVNTHLSAMQTRPHKAGRPLSIDIGEQYCCGHDTSNIQHKQIWKAKTVSIRT